MGKKSKKSKKKLAAAAASPVEREPLGAAQVVRVRGSYDAARTTTDFENYWSNTDRFDADSAHSPNVRETLVQRSRYEVTNNGYVDGIAQTYATDLVGTGPKLRMQTGSDRFNQLVEVVWGRWARAIQLRRKLWCMAHAKLVDGEAFATIRRNGRVRSDIKLDVVLHETEQCQTPYLPYGDPGYIDGVRFDQYGNPLWYDFLRHHPGSDHAMAYTEDVDRVPAHLVAHWFRLRRPGQHRAVPEFSSTLNTGAARRRWLEATVAAAETAADYSVLLKTMVQPEDFEGVVPLSTLEIEKRMMTALPDGYDAYQMKSEHPTRQFEDFNNSLINEQARPKSMPLNKASCNSAKYNYASGRLDHQTYYAELDVEREDCSELTLDVIFDAFFDAAVMTYGWFGGDTRILTDQARAHAWDWPKHGVADVESEAKANEIRLKSGQVGLHRLYSEQGLDLDDEVRQMAQAFGVDEKVVRERLLDIALPKPPGMQPPAGSGESTADKAVAAIVNRVHPQLNGNGALHGN